MRRGASKGHKYVTVAAPAPQVARRTYGAFEAMHSVLKRGHPTYAGVEDEEVNGRLCLQQGGGGRSSCACSSCASSIFDNSSYLERLRECSDVREALEVESPHDYVSRGMARV